jgi:L-ascorbate metabolism protein UlaG (beta-lactamase superfamily)
VVSSTVPAFTDTYTYNSASPIPNAASNNPVSPILDPALRRRARQFTKLVRRSAVARVRGQIYRPVLTRDGETGVTFIGHSSFFLQLGGAKVLIDPNFARWLFVLKRQRLPGLRIKDLPAIDLVLITHAHFDHLHRPSLRAIANATRRRGGKPAIVVPRDVSDLVSDLGYERIVDLEWWQQLKWGDLTITHTPSRHWGARVIKDHHRSFGGYVLSAAADSIYHAGDTAYFSGFREIGRRLQPQLALLPIGAYNPPSFRNVHCSPADAVQGFLDLGASWMIPMHYGSFRLSHEPIDEPLRLLAEEAARHGIRDRVLVMQEGITHLF